MSVKVGILVSGRGSNMVSLIDAEKAGELGGSESSSSDKRCS